MRPIIPRPLAACPAGWLPAFRAGSRARCAGACGDGCGIAGGAGRLERESGHQEGRHRLSMRRTRPSRSARGMPGQSGEKGGGDIRRGAGKAGWGRCSYSGLFAFTVETAGDYTVALGAAAWIDVLEDGKAMEPSTFGHGPECTTIRKMVTFALKPGVHVLQIAVLGAETLRVMVAEKALSVARGLGLAALGAAAFAGARARARAWRRLRPNRGSRRTPCRPSPTIRRRRSRPSWGRRLFYDGDLLGRTMSCATCHEQKRWLYRSQLDTRRFRRAAW